MILTSEFFASFTSLTTLNGPVATLWRAFWNPLRASCLFLWLSHGPHFAFTTLWKTRIPLHHASPDQYTCKTNPFVPRFISWRVALMELALQQLDIASATIPITATSDPYKMFQVHDYRSISFLRQSAAVKSASAETIKVFAQNYPELLKEKFFVNVPAIMGFVYNFMKLFVAAKTIKKFHPMSNGGGLAVEFGDSEVKGLGEKLPGVYGGKGEELSVQGKGPLLE